MPLAVGRSIRTCQVAGVDFHARFHEFHALLGIKGVFGAKGFHPRPGIDVGRAHDSADCNPTLKRLKLEHCFGRSAICSAWANQAMLRSRGTWSCA